MLIVFCWWADDGPTLNAGWSALLNFPEGSILVFLSKPTVQLCDFARGWSGGQTTPVQNHKAVLSGQTPLPPPSPL